MPTKEMMMKQLNFAQLSSDELCKKDQKILISFLLVFNVFEARLFKDGRSVTCLLKRISEEAANQAWFKMTDYQAYIDFFKERYVNEGIINHDRFGRLRLSGRADDRNTDRGNAKAVLLGKENSPEKVLRCGLCISYRFRNNLFHGNKNVCGLNAYYDCFEIINSFLVSLMGNMIENDFQGLQTKY